jgi:nucleotide-binding universal stress UspA family protein
MPDKKIKIQYELEPQVKENCDEIVQLIEKLLGASLYVDFRHHRDCAYLLRASSPIIECELHKSGISSKPRMAAVKKQILRGANKEFDGSEPLEMYKHIMVPLDGTELAECVLPCVETLTIGSKIARVTFVRVVETVRMSGCLPAQGEFGFQEKNRRKLEEQRKSDAEAYLKKIIKSTSLEGAVGYEVLEGKVAESLFQWAEKNAVDLIVIASHGRTGVSRWVMGSIAERMLRSTCIPVFMVRIPGK